uniref:Uncharacterized protein n=1 Tax=Oryza glumipatula TaxID=40148 RepID=A0A0E0AQT3_9ORYZ
MLELLIFDHRSHHNHLLLPIYSNSSNLNFAASFASAEIQTPPRRNPLFSACMLPPCKQLKYSFIHGMRGSIGVRHARWDDMAFSPTLPRPRDSPIQCHFCSWAH